MSVLTYQPAIEPQLTLGESPFRIEHAGSIPQIHKWLFKHVEQPPAVFGSSFAPAGSDDLWANRRPLARPSRRRRLPVVPATGRVITQQEIDDAFDD